jgi:AcrR family transcriptional regulator
MNIIHIDHLLRKSRRGMNTVHLAGGPMPETDPDPRLTRILGAAATRFTTDGFEATRLADVARDAGVAVGTIYLRYPGKAELLAAVLGQAEDHIAAAMNTDAIRTVPFPARFEAIFSSIMAVSAADPQIHRLMGIAPFALGHWQPGDRIRPVIAAQLNDGQASGTVRRDLDTGVAAAMAYGLVEGMIVRMAIDPGLTSDIAVAVLADASRRWLSA